MKIGEFFSSVGRLLLYAIATAVLTLAFAFALSSSSAKLSARVDQNTQRAVRENRCALYENLQTLKRFATITHIDIQIQLPNIQSLNCDALFQEHP